MISEGGGRENEEEPDQKQKTEEQKDEGKELGEEGAGERQEEPLNIPRTAKNNRAKMNAKRRGSRSR